MRQSKSELTNDQIILKIMELLKLQNKKEQDLIEYIGLANGTFTKWKYRNVKSYRLHLDKIAEYLKVSPDYLTEGVDDIISVHTLTPSEVTLLQYYRRMDMEERKTILKSAAFFVDATEYKKRNMKSKVEDESENV